MHSTRADLLLTADGSELLRFENKRLNIEQTLMEDTAKELAALCQDNAAKEKTVSDLEGQLAKVSGELRLLHGRFGDARLKINGLEDQIASLGEKSIHYQSAN